MAKKTKRNVKIKYESEKTYTVVAKFDVKGRDIEAFIPKLKNAKYYWIEKEIE